MAIIECSECDEPFQVNELVEGMWFDCSGHPRQPVWWIDEDEDWL